MTRKQIANNISVNSWMQTSFQTFLFTHRHVHISLPVISEKVAAPTAMLLLRLPLILEAESL